MKVVTKTLYVPIRNSTIAKGFEIRNFVDDTNKLIEKRGAFLLTDGQILKNRIEIDDIRDYQLEGECASKLDKELTAANLIAGSIKLEEDQVLDYEKREWSDDQKMYFGIENPFQVSEDPTDFGYSWALVDSHRPYLEPSERIHALLHGVVADRPFYCACHLAEVVYTSQKQFLCMSCGNLHCVLKEPLKRVFKQSLTEQEWFEYFDEDGAKREEEIDLEIIDFLEIENASKIWVTDYYEQAVNEFVFFTRSTKEELEDYFKHTASAEDFIQAGWTHCPTPPSLAYQVAGTGFEVDKLSNALTSLNEGILSFNKARTEIGFIKHGVLQLFHTIELILKIRLEEGDSLALKGKPDNPTVVKLLQRHGISFGADELRTIAELRKLRNAFQHAEAEVNYRSSLKLMRNSIVFIDRFCLQELHIWIAEHVDETAWKAIMFIPDIQKQAELITRKVLDHIKSCNDHRISSCSSCNTETVVSQFNAAGICISCRRVPKLPEMTQ